METNNGSTEAVSIENESSREDSSTEKSGTLKWNHSIMTEVMIGKNIWQFEILHRMNDHL